MKIKSAILSLTILTALTSTVAVSHDTSDSAFAKALQSEQRSQADRERDAGRMPEKVMEFFGIKPGMTVLEVLSSGGYYTEVLSHRVGHKGNVIAQNNNFILEVFDGRFAKEFDKRTAKQRLPNVKHYKKEFGEFDLNNEVDVVTVVLNYHDLYSAASKEKRMKILAQLKKALKPGGVLGLIDMQSTAKDHDPKLHRVNEMYVKQELAEAGFELDSEAAFLRNPNDDYTKVVFDPTVRGKTDRFVLRFRKPV
ncbi:class I SAM-dependent methyltransferase [Cognaticolwellia mytili]|uniref:class I SAM-dependent methyltransferase n=1 Tax=Cognaticolwellia mytili TaxID=1888913 RepID=UPI000A16DB4F|nr:class I SAM-dependent methyltransferase [Cognaticolwellia mytili]